jgi:tetratricopeptide (TPR) repeat protein
LEGVARVLNPGKSLRDFHAGTELENTLSIYVYDRRQAGAKAVSQVEQLALSRCARESGGKLWCVTCHDPHGVKAANEPQRVSAVCNSCHANLPAAGHPARTSDCISCHMPRLSPKDVAHAASTDHRILARPSGEAVGGESGLVRAWHEPAYQIRQRNLGLAELEASALPELHSLGNSAGSILDGLPAEQREHDPVVLAALADLALSHGNLERSESLFGSASELEPANAGYLMYLGIALKQKGNLREASSVLQKAIALDPSLQRAYLELSALYAQQGKVQDASAVLNEYLKWNPQSIVVRSALQGLK